MKLSCLGSWLGEVQFSARGNIRRNFGGDRDYFNCTSAEKMSGMQPGAQERDLGWRCRYGRHHNMLENSMVVESKGKMGSPREDVNSEKKKTDDKTLGSCHI